MKKQKMGLFIGGISKKLSDPGQKYDRINSREFEIQTAGDNDG